ncbi:phosphotyrosine protein phosphatase [Cryptosporangium phraense]|uniref:protein-tyrosine-phosphatase n=1 Tax=Cryptosporangium phraense TaxID=2593070 RepID=A0A545AS28_9ACTN|nr:phosphotyrosine protein phosphatase [Cryptosporangium phraense]TQS44142.1 phosphotyrosine protein phosphatase [Cryptosporangium phraense]
MTERFTVLMVCMGNICRSPMAERLLRLRLDERLADGDLVEVHGAGTGAWHEGEPMHRQAAEEVLARGGDPSAFAARALTEEMLESDLVLTATIEQVGFVAELVPSAASKTFVLGEFARLAAEVPDDLPGSDLAARGRALVAEADQLRDGARYSDEVPDPWGRAPEYFTAVADQIDDAVTVLADRLTTKVARA